MAAVYSNVASLFVDLQACYFTSVAGGGTGSTTCPSLQDVSDLAGPSDLPPQYCAGTAALTINVSPLLCLFKRSYDGHLRVSPGCTRKRDPLLARVHALAPEAHHTDRTRLTRPRNLWCVPTYTLVAFTPRTAY